MNFKNYLYDLLPPLLVGVGLIPLLLFNINPLLYVLGIFFFVFWKIVNLLTDILIQLKYLEVEVQVIRIMLLVNDRDDALPTRIKQSIKT